MDFFPTSMIWNSMLSQENKKKTSWSQLLIKEFSLTLQFRILYFVFDCNECEAKNFKSSFLTLHIYPFSVVF